MGSVLRTIDGAGGGPSLYRFCPREISDIAFNSPAFFISVLLGPEPSCKFPLFSYEKRSELSYGVDAFVALGGAYGWAICSFVRVRR